MRKIRGDPSWYPMALAIGVPMRLRCTHWVKPSLAWTVQLFPCGYASFFLKDFFERKSGPACPPHWPIPGPFPVNGLAARPWWPGRWRPQGRPGLLLLLLLLLLRSQRHQQRAQCLDFGGLEVGQRWGHRAGAVAVADPCGVRLHESHRIALALVAQGDVGQEEVAHQALANMGRQALLAGFGQVMGPQQDALRAQALGFLCVADGQGGAAAGTGTGNDGG